MNLSLFAIIILKTNKLHKLGDKYPVTAFMEILQFGFRYISKSYLEMASMVLRY